MHIKNRRGQSTVEYVLLVTAVVAVMIAFTTKQNSGLQGHLNQALDTAATDMENLSNSLSASHMATGQPSNGTVPSGGTVNVLPGSGK